MMIPLCVALDHDNTHAAMRLADHLVRVDWFKVGDALDLAPGFDVLVRSLIQRGARVMYDAKTRGIPSIVRKKVDRAIDMGFTAMTVNADQQSLSAAYDRGHGRIEILAAGVLTSRGAFDASATALKAAEAGVGLIGDPTRIPLSTLLRLSSVVTTGVRFLDNASNEHTVIASPSALAATTRQPWLAVVGRPITGAENPIAVAARYQAALNGEHFL